MASDREGDAMLREMAQHRGFKLLKSRRRKPGGDYGRYGLIDGRSGRDCLGIGEDGLTATAEEVAGFLRSGERATWKRSLIGAFSASDGDEPPPSKRRKSKARAAPHPEPEPAPAPQPQPEPEPEPEPEPALVIRSAAKADAAAIAALLNDDETAIRTRLAGFGRKEDAVLVAVRGDMRGCVVAHVVPCLQRPPLGKITLLVVREDARLQGIGAALLDAAEAAMRERGCEEIEVASAIDFESAHSFFRRRGYARTSYRFGKAVAADA